MNLLRYALAALVAGSAAAASAAAVPSLQVVAETRDSVWNAVVVDDLDRVYVSGPHWAGSHGPSVAMIDAAGGAQPYPDQAWNTEAASVPANKRFVNVNAIHPDGHGGLWVVDTGVTGFGGVVVPGGAKLVRIDMATRKVTRVYVFGPDVARKGSYVDDVRFHGNHAYLTDAGDAGLIILELDTGKAHRVLNDSPATRATPGRDIVLDGHVVRTPDGSLLRVNVDPLEVSPDGKWFYFASLEGPWSRIETRWLDDASLSDADLQKHVQPWIDLPPTGGTTMDSQGNIYFSDLAANAMRRVTTDKKIETILVDERLHWVDAPTIDSHGRLYLPVPQMDRAALFHHGQSQIQWPVRVYRLDDLRAQASAP
jgi:sugar lactone lactonase YvrE